MTAAIVPVVSLTPLQARLLEFIRARIESEGVAPSFDEMRDHLGFASKGNIHRLVEELQRRGVIRRERKRARCIQLVRSDEPRCCPNCGTRLAKPIVPTSAQRQEAA